LPEGVVAPLRAAAKSAGGKVDSFHITFGENDAHVIADLPDNPAAAALALAVSAGRGVTTSTIVLRTPDEFDQASGANVKHRPPAS